MEKQHGNTQRCVGTRITIWCRLMVWSSSQGGGAGGTVDPVAQAMAKAVQDRLNEIYPPAGKTVSPGNSVSILTTDAGIKEFNNPTINTITVPANPTVADLIAAGLVQDTKTPGATDTVSLASLPADTWTAVPASTIVADPASITVRDAAGNDITPAINTRKTGTKWEIISSRALTNLTITLED